MGIRLLLGCYYFRLSEQGLSFLSLTLFSLQTTAVLKATQKIQNTGSYRATLGFERRGKKKRCPNALTFGGVLHEFFFLEVN